MALTTISAATTAGYQSGSSGHPGPFRDSNGNIYVVGQPSGGTSSLRIYKSTNGGSTWSEIDTAGEPSSATGFFTAYAVVQDGDTLHMAHHSSFPGGKTQNVFVEYHTFTMSDHGTTPDEWVIVREAIGTFDVGDAADVTEAAGIEIAVRSDGDVIVFHPGTKHVDMGAQYFQLSYSRRESASWTTDIALSTSALNQGFPKAVMAPNDECHFSYGSGPQLYAATLDSGNSISSAVNWHAGTQAWACRPLTWDPDGTQRIMLLGSPSSGQVNVRQMQEDGSGDIAVRGGEGNVLIDSAAVAGRSNLGAAYDSVNDDVYVLFAATDDDLYYDVSSGGLGSGWGTDVELEDGTTINGVWANYYNNTMGYVVLDGTALKYGELALAAAEVAFPPFPRRQLTTVRM